MVDETRALNLDFTLKLDKNKNLTDISALNEASNDKVQELEEKQKNENKKHEDELRNVKKERNELKEKLVKLELELAFQKKAAASKLVGLKETKQSMTAADAASETVTGPYTSNTSTEKPRYAYTWILGGIDPDRPAYKGFLYDILVSVNLLKKLGSKAEFIVLTQLSHNMTGIDQLPAEDERLLKALGIKIRHMPKPVKSSFAQLVYEKFRPLSFTEYDRIMFLDGDIMPLNNLDYLFHLSEGPNPVLRPNLVVATRGEPCNTGMFIMHPEPGAYDEIQGVIQRQHESGLKLPYPHFSWTEGWDTISKRKVIIGKVFGSMGISGDIMLAILIKGCGTTLPNTSSKMRHL